MSKLEIPHDTRRRDLPPTDPIRAHRYHTGCAGSAIDLDGRCHTCWASIGNRHRPHLADATAKKGSAP